MRILDSCVV